MTELLTAPVWSDQQRTAFYYRMSAVQKDEVLGVVLAVFLGSFGFHHFYLRQNGLGILYLIFFWTGFPGLIAFLEVFFMPGRVRRFNAEQAALIAASLGPASGTVLVPASATRSGAVCAACGALASSGTRFCAKCGSAVFPA